MGDASQGAQAEMAMDPTAIDASSEPYEFVSESLQKRSTILDTNGIRGTRSHAKERVRNGTYSVEGTVTLHPSPADLDNLLPRILGAAASGDVFNVAETVPTFVVEVGRVGQTFNYSACKVNRATFRNSAGGLLELALDLIGVAETVDVIGNFPSLTLGVTAADAPYVMSDAVLVLAGNTIEAIDVEVIVDNALESRFATGSRTATSVTPTDRIVSLNVTIPFSTANELALYDLEATGVGATMTLTYTNGSLSTLFTFISLIAPSNSPVITGKTEVTLSLEFVARKSSTTAEIAVTSDATP